MATVALQWLKTNWNAAGSLAPDARLQLFRSCRLVAAILMLGVFPAMATASNEPLAVVAALVLYGVLPAAVAVDVRRPEGLDRAIIASLLIVEIVLIGGILRGLPPISALSLISIVCIEAYVVGSKAIRNKIAILAVLTCVAISAITLTERTFMPDGFSGEVSLWAPLTVAFALIVNVAMLTRAMLGSVEFERAMAVDQRILTHEIEAIVSETVVAVDRSGSVVRISDNAARVLGLTVDSLRGRGLSEMVLVADRPQFLSALSECAYGGSGRKLRVRLRTSADNTMPKYRWVEVGVSSSQAAPQTAIAILRDISEHVDEEERLMAAAADAEIAKGARSAFLSTVNHELRTPLNAIIGFSEILANPVTLPQSPERMQEYASIINGAGHDLLRMVTTMIDVTRLDSGVYEFEAETSDLRAVIETTVEAFAGEPDAKGVTFVLQAESGQEGSGKAGSELLEANIDTRALRNLMNQLLSNAAKFGDGRSPVVVSLSRVGPMIDIAVTDQGAGIAKEKLDMLGRHFARIDDGLGREKGGIGLGLSLARGLVALHGGTMAIRSVIGKGTTVTVSLPAAGEPNLSVSPISNVHALVVAQTAAESSQTLIEQERLHDLEYPHDLERIRA